MASGARRSKVWSLIQGGADVRHRRVSGVHNRASGARDRFTAD